MTNFRTTNHGFTQGVTVERIIVQANPASAVGVAGNGSIRTGIYVDDMLASIGQLSLPTTSPYVDWMINRQDGFQSLSITNPNWLDPTRSAAWEVRSKRRMRPLGETLWFVGVMDNTNGGTNYSVNYHVRTLLKLP
jgi:hypothetical protein